MGRHWSGSHGGRARRQVRCFAVLAAIGAADAGAGQSCPLRELLHPGRFGTYQMRGRVEDPQMLLGPISASCNPRAAGYRLGADGPLIAFEVILDRIPSPDAKQRPTRAKPVLELSCGSAGSREFCLIVDRSVRAGDIVRRLAGRRKTLITM